MQTWTKLHIALNNMWHICSTNKGNKKCVLEYCYFYSCFNVCLLSLLLFLFLWLFWLSGDWIMFSRTLKYGSEDLAALLVRTFKAFHSLLNEHDLVFRDATNCPFVQTVLIMTPFQFQSWWFPKLTFCCHFAF